MLRAMHGWLASAPAEIGDGVVTLRRLRRDDVPWLLAGCRDPDVIRWTPIPEGISGEQIARWVDGNRNRIAADSGVDWAVVRSDDGTPLGQCGLHRLSRQIGQGEVTYWVMPAARQQGVATRAVRCMTAFAFDHLGLQRLELLTLLGNAASQAVARRAGFIPEGRRRGALPFKGVRHDVEVFALLPSDLRAQ